MFYNKKCMTFLVFRYFLKEYRQKNIFLKKLHLAYYLFANFLLNVYNIYKIEIIFGGAQCIIFLVIS